jgi:hypothetical protein
MGKNTDAYDRGKWGEYGSREFGICAIHSGSLLSIAVPDRVKQALKRENYTLVPIRKHALAMFDSYE